MKITNIFVIIKESLLAVEFDGYEGDELSRLMDCWSDVEYLRTFFIENQKLLTNGFYGNVTINQAVEITLHDAERLENILLDTAKKGKTDAPNTLQNLFKPLNNNEYKISLHQKSKLKGSARKSWLRIYAIRIGPNMFVISGGGIKLTHRIEDSENLKPELLKLEATKKYLLEMGVLDEEDYELLEI